MTPRTSMHQETKSRRAGTSQHGHKKVVLVARAQCDSLSRQRAADTTRLTAPVHGDRGGGEVGERVVHVSVENRATSVVGSTQVVHALALAVAARE